MAEKTKIKKPLAAKDIKPGDMRQTIAEGRRKVGPAKDVKPGSAREKALKGNSPKKPASGGLTSSRRLSDVKKSRGPFGQLTVRKDNLPAVKKEPSRAIVKRGEGAVKKYEAPKTGVQKYEAPKAGGSQGGVGGRIARGIGSRALLTAGFLLDPSTFDYKGGGKAGEGSDKPSGPLMKGGKLPGYKYVDEKTDRLVSPAKVYAPKGGGGPERRQGSESPSLKREAPKAAEFKKKNLDANKKAGKKPDKAPAKATPKAAEPKKPGFKGNWVGAAPTEMQKRGGAKIKRKSFADLFKKD